MAERLRDFKTTRKKRSRIRVSSLVITSLLPFSRLCRMAMLLTVAHRACQAVGRTSAWVEFQPAVVERTGSVALAQFAPEAAVIAIAECRPGSGVGVTSRRAEVEADIAEAVVVAGRINTSALSLAGSPNYGPSHQVDGADEKKQEL